MTKFYFGPEFKLSECVRGFCGERYFRLSINNNDDHGTDNLDVELDMDEHTLKDLLRQIQNVLEKGK